MEDIVVFFWLEKCLFLEVYLLLFKRTKCSDYFCRETANENKHIRKETYLNINIYFILDKLCELCYLVNSYFQFDKMIEFEPEESVEKMKNILLILPALPTVYPAYTIFTKG